LAEHVMGARPADAMPLPVIAAKNLPMRGLRETYYEHGATLAHLFGARI
jgi:hypothetical protein